MPSSLSLSPRLDLFVFRFPKDFLPEEIEKKYTLLLNQEKSLIRTPIEYLNESIQGISFPGISDLLIEQQQISQHPENLNAQSYVSFLSNIEFFELSISFFSSSHLSLYCGL